MEVTVRHFINLEVDLGEAFQQLSAKYNIPPIKTLNDSMADPQLISEFFDLIEKDDPRTPKEIARYLACKHVLRRG